MLRPSKALRSLAVAVAVGSVASVAVPPRASARAAVPVPATEAAPGTPSPVVGDFDGDGRGDQLWYGPGSAPDHAWFGRSDRGFTGRAVTVGGVYTPLVADFDGNGRDDILWYAPGAADDYLWRGTVGRSFTGRKLSIGGTYLPVVADFNGDRRDDVLWYSPTADDHVWYGTADGFSGVEVSVNRAYLPVTGDFDGNGAADVLWYGAGRARDYLWRGTSSRAFVGAEISVNGVYTPVVGDFGGDGTDDVFWHAADGSAVLWAGRRSGTFAGSAGPRVGAVAPFRGDFDGDGADDLAGDQAGTAGDRIWYGGGGGFAARAMTVGTPYAPRVADFDGDGRDDIFWFAAGAPGDALWFAAPGRAFSSRPSSLDPLPGPGVALRQDVWATQFDPYGYVAHALGPTPPDPYGRQFGYTNTAEAFAYNYGRGFRVLEADWVRLADGTVLAAHDGTERRYGLPSGVRFSSATRNQLSGFHTVGAGGGRPANQFTPLFAEDVVDLLIAHPDVHIILDTKYDHTAIVARFVRLTAGRPDLMDRLLPHVEGQADLDALRALYPIRNYVLALYRSQAYNRFDDAEVARFVRDNRVPAVMMWWNTRDPALSLSANMAQQRRYTSAFATSLRGAGAVVYVHSITETSVVRRFANRGIGVYSNGPFPPFGVEPQPIDPPVESTPLV